MMGRFVITVGETPHDEIMSVSPKGLSLIELLILEEGRTVRADLLIDELWLRRQQVVTRKRLRS